MGLLRVAFIITEEVPDAVSLDSFVAAGLPGIDAAERVGKMTAFAGRLDREYQQGTRRLCVSL